MTILFLDTEFTDFQYPELISIALVCLDTEEEFYMENTSYNSMMCSGFVYQTVLPLLDRTNRGTHTEIAHRLMEWLQPFRKRAKIAIDYNGDYVLLRSLLNKVDPTFYQQFDCTYTNHMLVSAASNRITPENRVPFSSVQDEYKFQEKLYFTNVDNRQHHALVDARAMKYAWQHTIKQKVPKQKKQDDSKWLSSK